MSDIILIGDWALDKNTIRGVALVLLALTLLLVVSYNKIDSSEIFLESPHFRGNNVHASISNDKLTQLPTIKEGYTQLAFCSKTCSVINAETKEVIKHYQKGSNNCLLLNYLFNHPNKHLTEIDIASKVFPESPEKFYIRKAICNLKLDKPLSEQMFDKSESGVQLNTVVKLPSKQILA